jgi:two-component system CheB/CheR fusion protein
MILADSLEPDAFRHRVKIYATDLDEQALGQARAACYDAKGVASVPEPLSTQYFDQVQRSLPVQQGPTHALGKFALRDV